MRNSLTCGKQRGSYDADFDLKRTRLGTRVRVLCHSSVGYIILLHWDIRMPATQRTPTFCVQQTGAVSGRDCRLDTLRRVSCYHYSV